MATVWTLMMPAMHMLAALVILASSQEESNNRELLGQDAALVPDVIRPVYDSSWKAVDTSLKQQRNEDVDWRLEPDSQEPPKRRRPGRKRKRRPPQTGPDESRFRYTGALPPKDYGFFTSPYGHRDRAPLRIRPEESRQRYQIESDEIPRKGPHRRGHRRKQRPLLPDLENSHISYVNQKEEEYSTERPSQENDKPEEVPQSGNRDVFETETFFSELPNEEMEFGDARQEDITESSTKEPIVPGNIETESLKEVEQEQSTLVPHDKSYRRPYSIAKKQNQAITSPSDLKSLLKQSGGLSLSELLQQRNLSLADLLTGKRQALSALTSTAGSDENHDQRKENVELMDRRVLPLPESEKNPQSSVMGSSEMKIIQVETTPQSSLKELEEEKVIPLAEQYTTPSENSELNLDELTQEGPRRLPPVIKKSDKDEPASFLHNETFSIRERDPNDNPRKRLAAMQSRRNFRQRIKQPKIESTTQQLSVRTYNRYNNYISPHPRRKEATPPPSSKKSEDIFNAPNESKNLVDSIVEDDTFETTTVDSKTAVSATTYQTMEGGVPEEKPRLRLPALRPGAKHIRTNSELRRKHSKLSANKEDKQLEITGPEPLSKPDQAMKIEIQDIFGISNLVSTNKKFQKPINNNKYSTDIAVTLPTDLSSTTRIEKVTIPLIMRPFTTIQDPKEESAKDEIWEILRDTQGGARLSKILSDRNMTVNELVELRERGSSHIHLADIFHNASREPNPPEPFLSKSLIEPISKETYPLRALLEANIRDSTLMATHDPIPSHLNNAPLFVDYARNVRDKDENLDIITLFKEIANAKLPVIANNVKKDSEGTTYFTSVMNIKASEENQRKGRSKYAYSNNQHSTMYSSLPSFIDKNNDNMPEKVEIVNLPSIIVSSTTMKSYHVRDVDGDGLIVLGDLQKLDEIDNKVAEATNKRIEVQLYDDLEEEPENHSGLLNKLPASVRSATIASASVVGISMVLFLVTYVVYKCRQKKKNLLRRRESFHSQNIPTPIFESRNTNRNNCSMRSISPILVTRVYSDKMDTFDSQSAKETQDYLWDYIRKPLQ